jgi:two-component system response regulator
MNDYEQVEILLVEDNPNDAELTMRGLKKAKFLNNLYWVKDGQDALDFLYCAGAYVARDGDDYPKLILLDLKMPKVDGIEVLQRIKSDERLRVIPVVVMTSSNEQPDITESYRLGANGYVVKPVEFGAFAETVAKIGMYWMMVNRGLRTQ